MSGIDYTTDALLETTRTDCLTPEADALLTDPRLLSILTFEQMTTLVPQIMEVQEEYFVHVIDIAIDTAETAYAMPERAIGKKLRDVCLIDTEGNEVYLSRINPSDVKFYSQWEGVFYLQNNSVMLLPGVTPQYVYLRLRYYRRPSNLCETGDAGEITVIDTVTKTVTVTGGTWVTGDTVDFIDSTPSFDSLEDDAAITGVSNQDITFASLPDGLVVGDWISLSGTTPIPQLPYEAHPILAQLGACKALEAMGDANVKMAWARYQQMAQSFFKVITPRTDAPVRKIVSPNNIYNRGTGGGRGLFGPGW
jgi:hypothetical protein